MKSAFVAVAALAMMLGTVSVVAAQQTTETSAEAQSPDIQGCPFYGLGLGPCDGTGRGPGYGLGLGPRDGNGRRAGYGMGRGARDGNGQGVCRGRGLGPRDGMGRGPGWGSGRGPGFQRGEGWGAAQGRPGRGFVDEDGNGVCDRFQSNQDEE